MKKYIILAFATIIGFVACKKECNINHNLLKNKINKIKITIGVQPYITVFTYDFTYDSLAARVINTNILLQNTPQDTNKFLGQYKINYNSNDLIIMKIGLDNTNPYHKYKCYLNNNTISKINELDTITNDEFPYFTYTFNNKIDTVYEPNVFPTALNRICYDYLFDGNNYSELKFEYDYFNSPLGGALTHVKDTAYITYTNLPFNKYAPMQNMYSSSTLFNVGVPGEVIYDFIYLLGFEDYYFYPHNRNLVQSIRTVHDSTTIVYFNYEFNSYNQLTKVIINFREPTNTFLVYDYEYY